MVRGKYATKAANQLAQIDSDIVADLTKKLESTEVERDRLALELQAAQRNLNSTAMQEAARIAAEESARHAKELDDVRRRHRDYSSGVGVMPTNYAGRAHRSTGAQHTAGES